MKTRLPISVVIPTMNRPTTLKRTLECLVAQEHVPSEIIIIDQSESKQDQAANQFAADACNTTSNVKYYYQNTPSSTKARNSGLDCCKNDIVIFSDDDVDVEESTLINIMEMMATIDIALIAAVDTNMGTSKTNLGYLFGKKSFRNKNIGHVTLSMLGRYPDIIRGDVDTQWAMGYFFAIRKSLADKWNIRWDENLTSYAYAEDLDFSYTYFKRANTEGLRCILSERVKVAHLRSQEWRVQSYKNTAMYVINREYLSYKHFGKPFSRLATRWTNLGEFLFRIINRGKPLDLISAQLSCDKNRNSIKQQIILPWFYEKR